MLFPSLTVPTANAQAIKAFYGSLLGLPVLDAPATRASPVARTVQIGTTTVTFVETTELAGWHPVNHLAIDVPRNQFAEAVEWLESRVETIALDGESEFALGEPWHSDSVYFRGPDEIILELIARHSVANDSVEPFGPLSLLSVSEVGVAVPNARAAVESLAAQLDLPKFAGVSESFAAVGDEGALLIVVDAGRTWFPTADSPASGGPLHVELAGAPRAGQFHSGLGATITASV